MKKVLNAIASQSQSHPLLKKRMRIMLIALLVVFGGIIGFNLFKSVMIKRFFANFEPPAVSVSSTTVKTIDWEPKLEAIGTFVAINGVDINSEAAGKVVRIHFESGQLVDKGAPLVDLDDSVEQAELKFNQADLALKAINHQRQESLLKKGATPNSSVDEAKASRDQATSNIEKVETLIRQKHITAPFKGMLGIRKISVGEYLTPGQSAIVTLQSLDPLYLDFYLPEQNLKKLYVGQPIEFKVEEAPNLLFTGKITAIDVKVDPNTHNIRVQATVDNCPQEAIKNPSACKLVRLLTEPHQPIQKVVCQSQENDKANVRNYAFVPGMFAFVNVSQPKIANTLVVPSTAISYSLYGDSVFLIEEDKEKKDENGQPLLRVERKFITTGEQRGNYTVIKTGLKPGDVIVSSGELKLQNGTRVVINNEIKLDDTPNPVELSE